MGLDEGRMNVFQFIARFAAKVAEYSDKNLMQTYNLGVVFGPCIFKCPAEAAGSKDFALVTHENKAVSTLFQYVIEHLDQVFQVSSKQ